MFTAGDDGVSKIIRDGQGRISFRNYHFRTGSTDYAVIKTGIAKPDGGMLFGSNRGLLELKNDTLLPAVIKNAVHRNYNIADMRSDAAGNVWISTIGDGILICSFQHGDTLVIREQLTKEDGLPSLIYLQLLIDRENAVWAAGYNGVTRIKRTGDKQLFISNYGRAQGFIPGNFHTLKMMQDARGVIWIATSSGLMELDPATLDDAVSPFPALTHITIHGRLDTVIENTQAGMHLPHHANSISFSYIGIYFSDPAAVKYAYRLLGLDSNWIDAGNNRQADFQHVLPGSYTFQVKAVAGTNRWSHIATYHFTIEPPFWQHWLFITLCTGLIIVVIYGIIRNWMRTIKRKATEQSNIQLLISENLQYRLEIEQVISYFAVSMARKQTADELLWDLAKNCIAQLGFEDCVIYLKDEKRDLLLQKAAWGPKTDNQDVIINPIEIPVGKGIVGSVALNGKAEIVNDTTNDIRYIIDDKHRYSEIAVPIIEEGKVIGVIDSEHSEKGFYTDRHLQILTTIASLCADKLVVMKTAAERQKANLEALQNKQKATEARLQSMRLQMNPHFIFNALNSIQQMILAGHETNATRSLSKFSRLLRMVLIHSDKEKITLREELDMLHLYIDLESLRFKERFEYRISCSESIDKDEAMIPPLMIQPFVENAIWHGFMHKEGLHKLQIHFEEEGNDQLVCMIEDNGIGRQASQSVQQGQDQHTHTGKGIAVTAERLKIFSEYSGSGCSLQIIDLKDQQGNPNGTRIVLQFPSY